MYGGIASKIGTLAKKGSAADVTPNSVNWVDASGSFPFISSGVQTISGINTTIYLYFQFDFGDGLSIEYRKNGGAWTSIAELDQISISNNDTLDWGARGSGGVQQIIIKNASDSDAILDYIYFEFV